MNVGRLLGLALPLCATTGAAGVSADPDRSLRGMTRPTSPNHALAAPQEFVPAPDLVTRRYALSPAALLQALDAVALEMPLVFAQPGGATAHGDVPAQGAAAPGDGGLRRRYVARSRLLNFPDLVVAEALPDHAGSGLVLWSRSLYGHSDLGANRKRLAAWMHALDARLGLPPANRSAP